MEDGKSLIEFFYSGLEVGSWNYSIFLFSVLHISLIYPITHISLIALFPLFSLFPHFSPVPRRGLLHQEFPRKGEVDWNLLEIRLFPSQLS